MKNPETPKAHGPGRTRGMRQVRAEGSPLNRQVLLPAERFIYSETISGALLLVCAIVALGWANSPWSESYFALRALPVSFQIGSLSSSVTLGVMLGLVVGKVVGVTGFAWLAVRLGGAALPSGVTWRHVTGAGLIGGVGFTVSLFITGLAFSDAALIEEAKVGVLAASLVAASGGYLFLLLLSRGSKQTQTARASTAGTRQNWEMKRVQSPVVVLSAFLLSVASTTQAAEPPARVESLLTPASADSAFPQLLADGRGGVYMTWMETLPAGAGHRLRLAHRKEAGAWEEASTVHEGKTFWRNWADFPGLGIFPDGSVMTHWLARSGEGTYDYNINARISRDGGKTWGEPFLVNTDGKKAEHGFVSFATTDKGLAVVWLDGRETKGMSHDGGEHAAAGGAMTLRVAEFLSDGTRVRESLLDSRVCDCCQTAVVNTSKGLLAAYRDRSDAELRDISFVRPFAEKVEPRDFSKDGWKINACPVNGPALAARGEAVSVVWFTMGGGKPRVRAAVSRDGGDTFAPHLEVDAAFPLGRVDVALLPSGESLLSWLGRGEGGAAEIKAAFIDPAGALKPAFKVASTSMARASGFPRLELSGGEVVFAWTEVGAAPEGGATPPPSTVRTAVMKLRQASGAGTP